MMGCSFSQLS
jgi:hypothetical protein